MAEEIDSKHNTSKSHGYEREDIIIRLNKFNIERILFILVILALGGLNIYQYYSGDSTGTTVADISTSAVAEQIVEEEVEEIVEDDVVELVVEEIVEEEENETTNTTNTTASNTTASSTVPKSDKKVDLSIMLIDIGYELKGEDWVNINTVNTKISNFGDGFSPKIIVYAYDKNDDAFMETYVQEELVMGEVRSGIVLDKPVIVDIDFDDIDVSKTIKIELVNPADDVVISSDEKSFNVDS